jgi:hypothetical protein
MQVVEHEDLPGLLERMDHDTGPIYYAYLTTTPANRTVGIV